MKRYIFLSAWCVLFFSAMNFGMETKRLPQFKPGKPLKQIVNQENLQEPKYGLIIEGCEEYTFIPFNNTSYYVPMTPEEKYKERELLSELGICGEENIESQMRRLVAEMLPKELEKVVLLIKKELEDSQKK
jgi:hypothetical protein